MSSSTTLLFSCRPQPPAAAPPPPRPLLLRRRRLSNPSPLCCSRTTTRCLPPPARRRGSTTAAAPAAMASRIHGASSYTRKARWRFQLRFVRNPEAAAATSSTVPQRLAMGAAQVMSRSSCHGEAAACSSSSSRKRPLLGLLPEPQRRRPLPEATCWSSPTTVAVHHVSASVQYLDQLSRRLGPKNPPRLNLL